MKFSDDNECRQLYSQIVKAFGTQLRKACEKAGYVSAQSFAHALGQAAHTYRHWERGEAEPDFENLTRTESESERTAAACCATGNRSLSDTATGLQ